MIVERYRGKYSDFGRFQQLTPCNRPRLPPFPVRVKISARPPPIRARFRPPRQLRRAYFPTLSRRHLPRRSERLRHAPQTLRRRATATSHTRPQRRTDSHRDTPTGTHRGARKAQRKRTAKRCGKTTAKTSPKKMRKN